MLSTLTWRPIVRVALGVLVVVHALAHAVLPLRGGFAYPPTTVVSAITFIAFGVALVSLTAAGLGLLWSLLLRRHVVTLMAVGLVASGAALIVGWDPAAWWGLSLDAALAGALSAAVATGVVTRTASPRHPRRWGWARCLAEAVALAFVAYLATGAVLWPWHRHWGTTAEDRALTLPGDPHERTPSIELTHAVTIEAPPEVVWRWLVQLGQDRAGFYSYDWLERLALANVHNVYDIRPEWQQRRVGDLVRAAPRDYLGGSFGKDVGWRVTYIEPSRAMVRENWGAFVLHMGARASSFARRSAGRTRRPGPPA